MRKRSNLFSTNTETITKDQIEEGVIMNAGNNFEAGSSEDRHNQRRNRIQRLRNFLRYLNITIATIGTSLILFLWFISLPQYRICIIISICSSLFLAFVGCGDFFLFRNVGQYLYSGILFGNIVANVVCSLIEAITIQNYSGCLKGSYCRAIQSFSYAWPYSGSLALSILMIVVTITLAYYYFTFLSELSFLQEERMLISDRKEIHSPLFASATTTGSSSTTSTFAYSRLSPSVASKHTIVSFEMDGNI